MSLLGVISLSFVLGLSGAMAPGPLLTVCIAETARRGFVASVLLSIGHAALELGIVLAFIFGLQRLLANFGVALVISLLGGGFLLWMGYGLVFGVVRKQLSLDLEVKEGEARARLHPVSAGILVSMSNPYWFLWWVFVGGAYLLQARSLGAGAMVAFYIGHISSDFAWYMLVGVLVALGMAAGRQLPIMNTIYRGIMVVCAVFLLYLGLTFVKEGVLIARTRKVPEMKPREHLIERSMAVPSREPSPVRLSSV